MSATHQHPLSTPELPFGYSPRHSTDHHSSSEATSPPGREPASTTSASSGDDTPGRRVKFDGYPAFDPTVGSESVVSGVQAFESRGDTDELQERITALSNAVSQAHFELNEERQKRRLLELENETLKLKVLSLSMMSPEAAGALEATVDEGYGISNGLDLSQIYLGSNAGHHNRSRAMTAVEGLTQNVLPVCRKATIDDAMLAMAFENKEDVLVVRHIGSLGFGPAQTLAAYLSVFGKVQEVIEIEDRDEAIIVMTDASDSSPVYPHGLKVVSGGEVEIASYNEALSAGWLSAVHDTDSLSVPNGSLDSSSLLWHVTTPSGLGVHQSSLRSHAQTWDASRKSRPEPSTFAGDNEPPRMNLLEALQVFNEEDEKRVFTVRKVHKLGFKSQYALKKYFSQFGRVKDVVLLPMRAKPKPGPHGQVRAVRPSSMGFVVMQCPEDVQRILAYGDTHTIKGWPIEVRPFVRPSDKQESKVGTYGEGVHASATGLPKEGRSE